MNVLGIMSGTSLDGVDYALCRVTSRQVRLLDHWRVRFPARLQEQIRRAAANQAASHELGQLHHDLGRFYAQGAVRGSGADAIALVGLHGQTVFHHPHRHRPATFQAGEPAYLAERLRVPVIHNFRAADLAAGGQGAPLATRFHVAVFGRPGEHVCVNNLGGISNVTSIDWRKGGGAAPAVAAFDTGPANLLLDLAMRHYSRGRLPMDTDGRWAAQGTACDELLQGWLRHSFFKQSPPKSTGREQFGEVFFHRALAQMRAAKLSRFDALATLTEFTARSLALNYRLHLPAPPDRVILAGGGAANPVLAQAIRAALAPLNPRLAVLGCDALGWPVQCVEPAAFAYLAWLRWRGQTGNLPQTTGARRAVLCGQVTEP